MQRRFEKIVIIHPPMNLKLVYQTPRLRSPNRTLVFMTSILRRHLHKFAGSIIGIPRAPPDRILGLTEQYKTDPNPQKTNLTVGIYKDNFGEVKTFPSVAKAQAILDEHIELNIDLSYLPINGCPAFQENVLKFLYRESCPAGGELLDKELVSFVQTLSGTGALAVTSKFLSSFISRSVWIPNPSWANHSNVFWNNGFKEINCYTYYRDGELDVDGWLLDLERKSGAGRTDAPQCIVLHACCHNPTGVDPTPEQWVRIMDKVHELQLIPIIDMAYQGLDTGDLFQDAHLLRLCLDSNRYRWNNGLFLCQSFAKNMGLYGERVGSLSVVTPHSVDVKRNIDSQLKKIVRGMYSSPPGYGSRIANLVLSSSHLKELWVEDVKNMAGRLQSVKSRLAAQLEWASLRDPSRQHGMFLYTGLNRSCVDILREKYSIYLLQDGRLSLSGLNDSNIDYVCEALRNVSHHLNEKEA
ncbi:LADA_0G10594g1_1 [Lachancea dasiensis]|uniref:Aspartate aminotransferase n=1 Tax=Lachancea dasiensis TaxID=1072105 RepID=A0A1G4JUR5_9SACH|nr:LADA_0G10594g1_1 [Lachancea dasiensis]